MPQKHIRVVVRTRPTSDFAGDVIDLGADGKSLSIHIKKSEDGGFINNQQEQWSFSFDSILHNSSQEATYEECADPIVHQVMDGYNGTVIAYGQTGAGKTFTMTGSTESYKHRGVIPRSITQVFKEVSERSQSAITVRVSYLEIYNETLIDLLARNVEGSESALSIIDDDKGGISVKGLSMPVATNEEEALNLLFEGETNRAISDHQLNRTSSRSHCVFTLHIESRSRFESSEKVTFSKLNLVDLAGSERLSKTQSSGTTLKEAMYINKSLTFLEQVIIALADKKRDHIPYRQSKLTNVLRDSLGGNCNTIMIANMWGERSHIEETISTLRFATRVMCVQNSPVVNVQFDPIALVKKYEREIKELKQELAMHDTLNNKSHVQYEPYTDAQRYEIQKSVRRYLEAEEEDLEIVNLRQIRELFSQFKALYRNLEAELEDRIKSKSGGNLGALEKSERRKSIESVSGRDSVAAVQAIPRTNSTMDMDDDGNGVGDVEGAGFGIGVAPSNAKPSATPQGKQAAKDKKKKGKNGTPMMAGGTVASSRTALGSGGHGSLLGGEGNGSDNGKEGAGEGIGGLVATERGVLSGLHNATSSSNISAMASGLGGVMGNGANGLGGGGNAPISISINNGPLSSLGVNSALPNSNINNNSSSSNNNNGNSSSSMIGSNQPGGGSGLPGNGFNLNGAGLGAIMGGNNGINGNNNSNNGGSLHTGNAAASGLFPNANANGNNRTSSPSSSSMGNYQATRPTLGRNEAFEEFKRDVGREMNRSLSDNKNILKEKRKIAKDLCASVNDSKKIIDDIKTALDKKKTEKSANPEYQVVGSDADIIDTEEYALVRKIREEKLIYRQKYDALKAARSEADYAAHLADQCRVRLMSEFEKWYEENFASVARSTVASFAGTYPSHSTYNLASIRDHRDELANSEDLMDIGERFDKLQLERMSKEDPDSYAFYNARKNTERKILSKLTNASIVPRTGPPSLPGKRAPLPATTTAPKIPASLSNRGKQTSPIPST